jgi:hypothetical protein
MEPGTCCNVDCLASNCRLCNCLQESGSVGGSTGCAVASASRWHEVLNGAGSAAIA